MATFVAHTSYRTWAWKLSAHIVPGTTPKTPWLPLKAAGPLETVLKSSVSRFYFFNFLYLNGPRPVVCIRHVLRGLVPLNSRAVPNFQSFVVTKIRLSFVVTKYVYRNKRRVLSRQKWHLWQLLAMVVHCTWREPVEMKAWSIKSAPV